MAVKMRPARMSSAEYWRRRESERRGERIADEKERSKLLKEIYRSAVDQMTREIESFYQRYARDEQITLADARRRVSMLDMKEYERLAKQYVESRDFSPEANRQMKLYNLTMKTNRLELLRNRLGLEMVKMTNDTQTEISKALVERSLETFEEYAGILGESVRDPLALAATISQEPFKGAKWSERLWGTNQKGLYDSVTKTLENALISGKNAKQLASSLQKQYGRSLYEAERLMVTEMARCQTEAAKLSMEANKNEYYMVLTANAMGPCGDCSDLEDQTTRDPIPVKDMEPGVNAPPLHPSCHCATAPWWDEDVYQAWLDSGKAREGMDYRIFEIVNTYSGYPRRWEKDEKMTGMRMLTGTNPQYDPELPEYLEGTKQDYTHNCTNCVVAYSARRNKMLVTACSVGECKKMRTLDRVFNAWVGRKPIRAGGNGLSEILDYMKSCESGTLLVITVKPPESVFNPLPGHAFVAEKFGDKVLFLDPQQGIIYNTTRIFDTAAVGQTLFMRVDDLELSDLGKSACKRSTE